MDFSNYWYGTYRELLKDKFRIDKETLAAMQTVGQKEVRYSDLDYNGHMNNTYYLDVLCDHVLELAAGTHRVSFARVHYSKEAPLGDVLTILRSDADPAERSQTPAQYRSFPADCKIYLPHAQSRRRDEHPRRACALSGRARIADSV